MGTIDGVDDLSELEWRVSPDHAHASLHHGLLHQGVLGQGVADAQMTLKHVRSLKKKMALMSEAIKLSGKDWPSRSLYGKTFRTF